MGQIHPKAITLAELIRHSDCVFVVKKAKPFTRIVETELDSSGRFPPFQSPRYAFRIATVLKDETDAKATTGSRIEVAPAHDGTLLHVSRRYHLEGVHKSPILEFYHKRAGEIEKKDSYIVFLSWREMDSAYAFAADDAVEALSAKAKVIAQIRASGPGR